MPIVSNLYPSQPFLSVSSCLSFQTFICHKPFCLFLSVYSFKPLSDPTLFVCLCLLLQIFICPNSFCLFISVYRFNPLSVPTLFVCFFLSIASDLLLSQLIVSISPFLRNSFLSQLLLSISSLLHKYLSISHLLLLITHSFSPHVLLNCSLR